MCTNGDKGSDDRGITSASLAKVRSEEQLAAADSLGVEEVIMLGYPDGELEDTKQFRGEVVKAIRRFRPDVVICPDPFRMTHIGIGPIVFVDKLQLMQFSPMPEIICIFQNTGGMMV